MFRTFRRLSPQSGQGGVEGANAPEPVRRCDPWSLPWWRLVVPLFAVIPLFFLRNFTVDDAFVGPRYAAHAVAGFGYRFNLRGPVSDGVTPLPWVPLLALLPGSSPLERWQAARGLGAVAWVSATLLFGAYTARINGSRARWVPLTLLALSAPLAAWAVAGLETGVVVALTTLAVTGPRTGRGNVMAGAALGLAAAFRPELIVFAGLLTLGRTTDGSDPRVAPWLLALLPWFAVVGLRLAFFGQGAPLAVAAKPSDLRHGLVYVCAGVLLAGFPALLLAPRLLFHRDAERSYARNLLLTVLAHGLTVAVAGGDWMPLSRLLVPAFPALLVAGIAVAARSTLPWTLLRTAVAAIAMGFPWWRVGAEAACVVPRRLALIEQIRPLLTVSDVVATLDIGWIGAATEASIVDLAGVTDDAIAHLPGGHTSKRIPTTLLDARAVTVLVLLRAAAVDVRREDGGPYARQIEERLASEPWVRAMFTPTATIRAGTLTYVVWRRPNVPERR